MPSAATKTVEVAHKDKCPADRVETYVVNDPKGRRVQIARCIDCGEHNASKEKRNG